MQGNRNSSRQKKLVRHKDPLPKTGVIQSIKGYLTNISYGLQGISFSFSHRPKHPAHSQPLFYVGGKPFQSLDQCILEHQTIVWFTYRKNCKINLTLTSDMGWGCMIRVAQMVLAETIKRFFKAHSVQVNYSYLIAAFLQSQTTNKYSLSRFLDMAHKLFLKRPGDWFSISQASIILQELQSLKPLKGTETLKILFNNQSLELSSAQNLLENQEKKVVDKLQFGKQKAVISLSHPKNNDKSLLIIISAKLGNKQVTERNFTYLLEVMTWPWIVGCLGGRPKQARFLTGRNGDKLSYLDPHYVEKEVERINLSQQINKFSCKQYRLMDREDLDPNIAFCFFIKNRDDLEGLSQSIQKWKGQGIIQVTLNVPKDKSQWFDFGNTGPYTQAPDQEVLDWRSNSSMESSFLMD